MKVVIFGLGYVGCTAAACIASEGHQVVGVDVSEKKVADIQAGICPIEEPGLGELIAQARQDDLLSAQQSIGDSLSDADLAIVCVGTPSGPDGAHDMRYIFGVTNDIAQALANGPDRTSPLTVAYRSTMRSGTIDKLIMPILNAQLAERTANLVELVYNPEFLRESSAIKDYREPPKIVVGTHDGKAILMLPFSMCLLQLQKCANLWIIAGMR
jgi:GDP-mannose 6-dehydrogenase